MTSTIIQETNKGDTFYLNHSCLNTLSFGSEDMAWTGTEAEAEDMLNRVIDTHVNGESDCNSEFFIMDLGDFI